MLRIHIFWGLKNHVLNHKLQVSGMFNKSVFDFKDIAFLFENISAGKCTKRGRIKDLDKVETSHNCQF